VSRRSGMGYGGQESQGMVSIEVRTGVYEGQNFIDGVSNGGQNFINRVSMRVRTS